MPVSITKYKYYFHYLKKVSRIGNNMSQKNLHQRDRKSYDSIKGKVVNKQQQGGISQCKGEVKKGK